MKGGKKVTKTKQKKKEVVNFAPGDSVKVHVKILEEEGKIRIQVFEGVVIRRRGRGLSETFTVRRVSYGEGMERIFPLNSPMIDHIEVVKKGKVRRAKLYYLRGRKGKKAKISEQKETVLQNAQV
ncbi:MAG: 50S ribosomal protein L19 [Candidatus Omnitrophica bacterium]|nr:50S ribosomal protein L19 [Candidatus Omnitrophota bacterium]